jgi:hypothetical protein
MLKQTRSNQFFTSQIRANDFKKKLTFQPVLFKLRFTDYDGTHGQSETHLQTRNSAGNPFAENQAPSVADGLHTTAAWPHSIIAGGHAMTARVPSASIPDYTDTAAMPPGGQSALWKYKGIYIQADQRVGQWSDVVSIPVAGSESFSFVIHAKLFTISHHR